MDEIGARRRRDGVGGGGFTRLRELRAQRGFPFMEGSRDAVRRVVRQSRPREHEAPRADVGMAESWPG